MGKKASEKNLKEKRVEGEIVFTGNLLQVSSDGVELATGERGLREVVHHPGGVVVIPVIETKGDYEIALVKQYRYPVGEATWELPAGTLEDGETLQGCARRELIEETYLQPSTLTKLTDLYTSPGYSDECLSLFLARDLTPLSEDEVDRPEGENLVVGKFNLSEVLNKARNGGIKDGKTLAGLFFIVGDEWTLSDK